MAIDLSEYIFVGLVSSIDAVHGTAVVTRPDRDGRTTAPLPVLQRGSTRVLSHPGDMTLRIGGTLTIEAGTLDVRGGGDVVASGISLTGHVHGGVQSGGSTTSGPQ